MSMELGGEYNLCLSDLSVKLKKILQSTTKIYCWKQLMEVN